MDKVKIYIATANELKDEFLLQKLYQTVSDRRQAKIDRLRFEKDKRLSLAAELLLKKALSNYGIDRYTVCQEAGEKPYLKDIGLHFSLSHSEEMVMCAISQKEVGCDTQKITHMNPAVAKRFFFASEYEAIMSKPTIKEREDTFFRLWVLKESYMKATGLGMNAFCIELQKETVSVLHQEDNRKFFFKEYDFQDGYKYAVCALSSDFEEVQRVSFI